MATRKKPPRPWNVHDLQDLGRRGGITYLKAIPVLILEAWVGRGRKEEEANYVMTQLLADRIVSSGLRPPFKPKGTSNVIAALSAIQNSRNLAPPLIEYQTGQEMSWVHLPHYETLLQEYRKWYCEQYTEDYKKLFPPGTEPKWEQEPSPPQLPSQALEPEVTRKRADVQSLSLKNRMLQVVQEYEEAWEKRAQDADNRARALEQQNRELRESSSALGEITDAELKKLIEPLFRSNSPFDTILREVSAVFETTSNRGRMRQHPVWSNFG